MRRLIATIFIMVCSYYGSIESTQIINNDIVISRIIYEKCITQNKAQLLVRILRKQVNERIQPDERYVIDYQNILRNEIEP